MIKLFYHKEYYTGWCSELFLLYKNLKGDYNINDKRFYELNDEKIPFEYVSNINECDYVVLPYKWRGLDSTTEKIVNNCIKNNKKILIFYNDDDDSIIPINENIGLIFRTSFYLSTKKQNEHALVPFFDDLFENNFIEPKNIKLNIGFCGLDHFFRKKSLSSIKNNTDIVCDFIVRKSFWAREVDEKIAINDFNENLKNNIFSFTSRGSGNFSYRFYQILSMGRIPVLLDTDCVLPFIDEINYNEHCVIVNSDKIEELPNYIVDFYNQKTKNELYQIQKNNRELYVNYFSPSGFIKKIKNIL